jgi:hypothetical protein
MTEGETEIDPIFQSAPEHLSPQQREEVRQYIKVHPELKQIIQDFITAVVSEKPDIPLDFAREYFEKMR